MHNTKKKVVFAFRVRFNNKTSSQGRIKQNKNKKNKVKSTIVTIVKSNAQLN